MKIRTTSHLAHEESEDGYFPTKKGERIASELEALLPGWKVFSYDLRIGMVGPANRTMNLTMEVVELLSELYKIKNSSKPSL